MSSDVGLGTEVTSALLPCHLWQRRMQVFNIVDVPSEDKSA